MSRIHSRFVFALIMLAILALCALLTPRTAAATIDQAVAATAGDPGFRLQR